MAEPSVTEVFQALNNELTNVSNALTAQGISNIVVKYDGSPKNYREWIKSIEKYATLVNIPDDKKKLIAYQSASGAVSGFIHRYMEANPQNTWGQLKQQLALRFSDVTDPQIALTMLRSVKQKHGENIQIYAERILSLAEEAYNNQGGNAIERQLIDTFVDGLNNDQLKLKILRDRPDTLQGAIAIATNEHNLRNRVSMSGLNRTGSDTQFRDTPMEVDHSRGQRHFNYKNRDRRVNEVHTGRKPQCWGCGQVGHVVRDCKAQSRNKPPMGHGRGRFTQNKPPGHQEN